jgi:hypothetical protein
MEMASSKRKSALLWIPVGILFAFLAPWPAGLLVIPLYCLLALVLRWIAGVQERFLLRTYDKYGEEHPITSWSALARWLRARAWRSE